MFWLLAALGALAVGSAITGFETDDEETSQDERAPDVPLGNGAQMLDSLPDDMAAPCLIDDTSEQAPPDPTDTPDRTDPEGDDYDLITGTDAADTLAAEDGAAFLTGRGGDDLMTGAAGDDEVSGGLGDDTAFGGAGDDTLRGEGGDDSLWGEAGNDELYGAEGNDTLSGGTGADSLAGGDGDDVLTGDAGDDSLHGLLGNDSLSGGAGEDVLFGGFGNDTLSGVEAEGEAARDFLNGGQGDDDLLAGAGDVVSTGSGNDTVTLDFFDTGDEPIFIVDFSVAADTLVINYEETGGTTPGLTIEEDAEDDTFFRILLDEVLVAEVLSDAPITSSHISLQPVSGP